MKQLTDVSNMAAAGSWSTPETKNSSSMTSSLSCGGAAVLLSDAVEYTAAGSNVALACRAVGTSPIHWELPGRKVGYHYFCFLVAIVQWYKVLRVRTHPLSGKYITFLYLLSDSQEN